MARLEIKVWTTGHGCVSIDRHFDELTPGPYDLDCSESVRTAIRETGEDIARAHKDNRPDRGSAS